MAHRTKLIVTISALAWLVACERSAPPDAAAGGGRSDEEPRLVFAHFWGNADALMPARGLRAALDHTNVQR